MVAQPGRDRFDFLNEGTATAPPTPSHAEHLLRVAGSVNADAQTVWAELWREFKPHVTPGGVVSSQLRKGFVPACGWPEFFEKLWLLKHYLDSNDRICRQKR